MTTTLMIWLNVVSTLCWPVCFWWMWRISVRQNALISQLRQQTREIEEVARDEHAMIKNAQPRIGEIHETVHQLAQTNRPLNPPGQRPA